MHVWHGTTTLAQKFQLHRTSGAEFSHSKTVLAKFGTHQLPHPAPVRKRPFLPHEKRCQNVHFTEGAVQKRLISSSPVPLAPDGRGEGGRPRVVNRWRPVVNRVASGRPTTHTRTRRRGWRHRPRGRTATANPSRGSAWAGAGTSASSAGPRSRASACA